MFIFSQCKQGINVKHTLVHLKAYLLLPNTFGAKGYEAGLKVVMRFMRKHRYVYCTRANEATRAPQEVCDKAREFLELIACSLLAPIATGIGFLTWTRCPFIFPTTAQRLLKNVAPRQFTSARQGTGQRGQWGRLPSRLPAIFDANDYLQR
jgi:hypothetical protein